MSRIFASRARSLPAVVCLLGLLLPASRTEASSDPTAPEHLGQFTVARLHYTGGGDWYSDPSSLPNLLEQLQLRTGIPTAREDVPVTLDDERLYSHPFLYATGHGTIALSPQDLARLRRYLDAGGFWWVDDNYGFDRSFRRTVSQLYPDGQLVPLSSDHPIYRAYYALPGLPKIHYHDGDPAQGFGLFRNGRMVIFYSWSSDIGDGLEDPSVHGDPANLREAAMKMAINVCIYALTQP
jgi:hypothetical protein